MLQFVFQKIVRVKESFFRSRCDLSLSRWFESRLDQLSINSLLSHGWLVFLCVFLIINFEKPKSNKQCTLFINLYLLSNMQVAQNTTQKSQVDYSRGIINIAYCLNLVFLGHIKHIEVDHPIMFVMLFGMILITACHVSTNE